jgi:flagellar protein FliT
MNRVQPIFELTVQMQILLEDDIATQERKDVIDQLNMLLLERETFMEQATEPFTKEEIELGKKLVPMNREIEAKMEVIFSEIKDEMKQVKKQKQSNRKYVNPYENIQTIDGMFMDKKK